MFRDREEAGRLLATRLGVYRDDPSGLILALPRGGVAVGYTLSLALRLPLDVFITRKLGAPGNPEYAIGAVTETGSVYLNPEAQEAFGAFTSSQDYLERTIRAQQQEMTRRQALYRRGRPLPALTDRTVLLVDDGIATGSTFLASIEALRKLGVKRLIAAIPVGPPATLRQVGNRVDELVVLMAPDLFFAVGNHYENFTQVEDVAVVRYLAAAETALRESKRTAHA